MHYRDLIPSRKTVRLQLLILAVGQGIAEAAFIFVARHGLSGGGLAVLIWLSVLVALRFFLQDRIAGLEVKSMRDVVSGLREKLLTTLRSHAVPAYRSESQRKLTHALGESAPRVGEGFLARSRVQAALLQGFILIPCLFFISWRLALMSLLLVIPAWLVTRWRSRSLRALERAEVRGRMEGQQTLTTFSENLESTSGGIGLTNSTEVLNEVLGKFQEPEWQWRTAQARYPALLEAGFFFALAGLVLIGGSSLGAWESWILFSGLLLLAYRPIREAARNYPISLQGTQALDDCGKLLKEWEALPQRMLPAINTRGEKFALHQVDFGYEPQHKVLRNFSAEFDARMITGITGPNGAGKTTLLRLLANVEIPTQGQVYWPGAARHHGAVAYLPQRVSLGWDWPQWAHNLKSNQPVWWNDLDSLLQINRLLSKGEHPKGLSGGERQRMALARVLSSDAPFLLMDEPTTALPGDEREQILAGVLKLWRRHPLTPIGGTGERGAIVVSHEPFLGKVCDTMFALNAEGMSETAAKHSQNPVPQT